MEGDRIVWLNRGSTYLHGSWLIAGRMSERLQQKLCASGSHLVEGNRKSS
jgi:hypothetical protein